MCYSTTETLTQKKLKMLARELSNKPTQQIHMEISHLVRKTTKFIQYHHHLPWIMERANFVGIQRDTIPLLVLVSRPISFDTQPNRQQQNKQNGSLQLPRRHHKPRIFPRAL